MRRRLRWIAMGVLMISGTGGSSLADGMQHVWLHYDYMAGEDGESYAPDPAGIQMVIDAFARHGVILHVDPQHDRIPVHSVIVFDAPGNPVYTFDPACTGPDAVGFSALKAEYFHPASNHPWHYMIFGKHVQVDSLDRMPACHFPPDFYWPGTTGYAELPGSDAVVTFGDFHDLSGLYQFFDFASGAWLPGWPVPAYEWATIVMHELGHNLGLFHGGSGIGCCGEYQTDNLKPNYVSVMNYAYSSYLTPIITASTQTASGYWYRVDYSDEVLSPLDERNLSEPAGIGPTRHPSDYIEWCCHIAGFQTADGPFDWNLDGDSTETGLAQDLNNDGVWTVLTGFDDWAEVHAFLSDEDRHPKVRGTAIQ